MKIIILSINNGPPHIIDYYNYEPYMIEIIDNMNRELGEVQKDIIINFRIDFTVFDEINEKHKIYL